MHTSIPLFSLILVWIIIPSELLRRAFLASWTNINSFSICIPGIIIHVKALWKFRVQQAKKLHLILSGGTVCVHSSWIVWKKTEDINCLTDVWTGQNIKAWLDATQSVPPTAVVNEERLLFTSLQPAWTVMLLELCSHVSTCMHIVIHFSWIHQNTTNLHSWQKIPAWTTDLSPNKT